MKTCKSPTTNTPSDLRHPWSRKTFSLCRHKTKGRLPLQRRGPGLRKFQISRAFHFKSHRVLTKEQGKISLCLTKTISACGLVEFFWSSFVSSLCSVENKYLNLSLKIEPLSNHFETNIVCFASNQAIFSFWFTRWLTSEVWSISVSCWRIFQPSRAIQLNAVSKLNPKQKSKRSARK